MGQQWTRELRPRCSRAGGNRSGIPWWVWLIMAFFGVIAILYLVLDALAGTHGHLIGIALSIAGPPGAYQPVANALGYTSRGTAYNVAAKALREQTAEAVAACVIWRTLGWMLYQLALWGCRHRWGCLCRCCRGEDRARTGAPERA